MTENTDSDVKVKFVDALMEYRSRFGSLETKMLLLHLALDCKELQETETGGENHETPTP